MAALNVESKIARIEWEEANKRFEDVISQVPSGLPYPDSIDRIHSSSRELSAARERFMAITAKASKFVVHGEVPEDLRKHLRDKDAG